MNQKAELTIDLRYLPRGRRGEAVLHPLSGIQPGDAITVVSDSDPHSLQLDLNLEYPGKFVMRRLPSTSEQHRAIIAKVGDTPHFHARWEVTSDAASRTVHDPTKVKEIRP